MKHSPRTYFWSYLALLGLVVGFCGASIEPQISVREFRQLPQSKRLRLERNLDSYLALSESERSRYWEMHREINEYHLAPLMNSYEQWLATLSPFDRQLLRTTADPAEKIAEVEKILKTQRSIEEHQLPELIARIIKQKNAEELESKFDGRRPSYRILNFFFSTRPEFDYSNLYVFSEPQLNILLDDILLQQLPASKREKLESESLQGIARMIHILEASLSQSNNPKLYWPSPATLQTIEETFSLQMYDPAKDKKRRADSGQKDSPQEMLLRKNDMHRRIVFRRTLVRSMMVYEMQQFERESPVTHKELLNFFKTLDSSKQHALLNSPFEYQAEALKWTYIWEKQHAKSIFSDERFTKKVLQVMDPRPEGPRSGPNRRPGEKEGKLFPPRLRGRSIKNLRPDRPKEQ